VVEPAVLQIDLNQIQAEAATLQTDNLSEEAKEYIKEL